MTNEELASKKGHWGFAMSYEKIGALTVCGTFGCQICEANDTRSAELIERLVARSWQVSL